MCVLVPRSWSQQVNSQVNATSGDAYVSAEVDATSRSAQVSAMANTIMNQGGGANAARKSSSFSELLTGQTPLMSVGGAVPAHFTGLLRKGSRSPLSNGLNGAVAEHSASSANDKSKKKSGPRLATFGTSAGPVQGAFPDTTREPYWPSPPMNSTSLSFFGTGRLTWAPNFDSRHLNPNYRASRKHKLDALHPMRNPHQRSALMPSSSLPDEDVSSGLNTNFGLDNSSTSLQNPLASTSPDLSYTDGSGD